jgi:hypothetical protein
MGACCADHGFGLSGCEPATVVMMLKGVRAVKEGLIVFVAMIAAVYGYNTMIPVDDTSTAVSAEVAVTNNSSNNSNNRVTQRLVAADQILKQYGSHFDQMPDYVLRDLVARYEQLAADTVLQSAVSHHKWMQLIRHATDAEMELNRRQIEAQVEEQTKKFEREWEEKMREALK